ncbi:translation elongation factor Ts [Erysipelothrix urinaevulpis]|uniref:translation elongation factor Ts n=1 Tax=Erysipelothrix urinaevulpis TaxID=2683717 RepID=UPI001359B84A|nr:translation elongation factor Ts [Erysipelothrix urinaevulpis]
MITAKLVKELRDRTGAGMMDCKKALEATEGDITKAIDWLREKGISSAEKKSGRIAADGLSNLVVDGNKAVVIEVNSETDFVAKNEEFLNLVNGLSTLILNEEPKDLDAALALDYNGSSVADAITQATAKIGEKISLRRFEIVTKTDDQVFGEYIHMGGRISAVTVVEGSEEFARDIAMQVASMSPIYVSRKEVPAEVMEHERNIQIEIIKNDPALADKPEKVVKGIVEGRVNKTLQDVSLVDQPFFKDPNVKVAQVLKDQNADVVSFVRFAVGEGIEKREEDFAEEVAKASKVN